MSEDNSSSQPANDPMANVSTGTTEPQVTTATPQVANSTISNLDDADACLGNAMAAVRREIAREAGDGVTPMQSVNHLQSFYNQVEAIQRGIAAWRAQQKK